MFLDIFVLFILAVSTLIAFMRGFIREALTLVTLWVASAAAYYGGAHLEPFMNQWLGIEEGKEAGRLLGAIPMPLVSSALSYGLIFIVMLLIFSISSHFLAEFIKSLGLGAVDRSLGALFGFLRGLLLLAILYLPIHFLLDQKTKDSWFDGSRSIVYLEKASTTLADWLPEDLIEETQSVAKQEQNEKTSSGAREKLQALDVLQSISPEDREKLLKLKESGGTIDPESQGYSDEFRQQLDSLFKETNSDYNTNE